jgi:hypothetical protein
LGWGSEQGLDISDVSQGHEILGTAAQWPWRNKPYDEKPNDIIIIKKACS